jgi:UDPglucose 6-dehydrogenase
MMKNAIRYSLFFLLCGFFGMMPAAILAENITVIGIGRLGICIALSLEKAGYNVLGVDVFPDYVKRVNDKTFVSTEPFVTEYLRNSTNFRATTSLKEALEFSDIYLIAVQTTTGVDTYDYRLVSKLLKEINSIGVSNKHIVMCSTVFPGFAKEHAAPLLSSCSNITLSYNPPFIAQGDIMNGYRRPDMVLIGEGSKEAGDLLESLYRSMCPPTSHIARMSVESAELGKLALNCFVTAKIAFANLVGDIADETPGADKFAILGAIGKDQRVGTKCLLPGYGFGGPCFPRDNRALARYASLMGIEPALFRATDQVNDLHAEYMARKFLDQDLEEYVFEDICYKPNSPVKIIDASQKLLVAKLVAEKGKKVTIIDSEGAIVQVKAKHGDLFNYVIRE